MNGSSKIAVIDIGSNSVRLVVYDNSRLIPLPIFSERVFCGLIKDIESTGRLNSEAFVAVVKAIKRFVTITCSFMIKLADVNVIATAAIREAKDGLKLKQVIEGENNVKIRVLLEEEEANYGALGVLLSINNPKGLVCDLGGGSLELSWLENAECIYKTSFPFGALRLKCYNSKTVVSILDDSLTKYFDRLVGVVGEVGNLYLIGGSFRSIAKAYICNIDYPLKIVHNLIIDPDKLVNVMNKILTLINRGATSVSGVSSKRYDTIENVILLTKMLISCSKTKNVIFSGYGPREGILYEKILGQRANIDPLIDGCIDMIDKDQFDYGKEIFEWISNSQVFGVKFDYISKLLLVACILSNISRFRQSEYRARFAFESIIDSLLLGINHQERIKLALILFYSYKNEFDLNNSFISLLGNKDRKEAKIIGLLLRLSRVLACEISGVLYNTTLLRVGNKLYLYLNGDAKFLLGELVARRLEELGDALNLKVEIKLDNES